MATERALATVLFTDIVDSTKRAVELGDRVWREVLERHHVCVRRELRRFGGREIATAGDGFLAAFEEPERAIQCAWAIRDCVRKLGIEIRSGLHMGKVELAGRSLGGVAVHIGARVAAHAGPGEVLVSSTVRDALAGAGFGFEDRGTHDLKGVPGEWRLYDVSTIPASEAPRQGLSGRARRAMAHPLLVAAGAFALLFVLAGLYVGLRGGRANGGGALEPGAPGGATRGEETRHSPAASHRQVTFLGSAYDAAISPDGKTFAYVDAPLGSEQRLMVKDLAGGEPLELARHDYIHELRWSPDGSELLFMALSDTTLEAFLIPRLGGSPRRMRVVNTPSWSPDGSHIVSVGSHRIGFTARSTNETTFVSLPGLSRPQDVDWSPTGTHLAILARRGDRYGIWSATLDGRDLHRLVADTLPLHSPRWSRSGDALYYLRDLGQTQDLLKLPVSRAGRVSGPSSVLQSGLQVARDPSNGQVVPFTISRDGRRILYTRGLEYSNLWVADPGTIGKKAPLRQLTNSTTPKWIGSVSPDGQELVFTEGDPRSADVFIASLEAGSVRQVTFVGGTGARPVWSPDGRSVAFRAEEGGTLKVWTVEAAGGTPRVFGKTRMSDDFLGFLSWTPANYLLYQRPGNRNFARLDPLTEEEQNLVPNDSVGWMLSPHVAPDGKRVALFWNRSPGPGIWTVSLADTAQLRLQDGFFWPIGWSPDGEWVYAWKNGERQILRLPSRGGPAEEVLTLPCALPVRWVAMAPDGKRFVCNVLEARYDVWLMENFDPVVE